MLNIRPHLSLVSATYDRLCSRLSHFPCMASSSKASDQPSFESLVRAVQSQDPPKCWPNASSWCFCRGGLPSEIHVPELQLAVRNTRLRDLGQNSRGERLPEW